MQRQLSGTGWTRRTRADRSRKGPPGEEGKEGREKLTLLEARFPLAGYQSPRGVFPLFFLVQILKSTKVGDKRIFVVCTLGRSNDKRARKKTMKRRTDHHRWPLLLFLRFSFSPSSRLLPLSASLHHIILSLSLSPLPSYSLHFLRSTHLNRNISHG